MPIGVSASGICNPFSISTRRKKDILSFRRTQCKCTTQHRTTTRGALTKSGIIAELLDIKSFLPVLAMRSTADFNLFLFWRLCLFDLNLSMKLVKKFSVYKCKLSLSLALPYLAELVIVFFLQNGFKYKRIHNSFWRNFPERAAERAKQIPSKVLFVGKKTRRPFGHCAPTIQYQSSFVHSVGSTITEFKVNFRNQKSSVKTNKKTC